MVNTGRAFAGNFLLHKHCTIQYQAGTVSATQIEGRAITPVHTGWAHLQSYLVF